MDLHIVGAEPTTEERAAVDVLLGAPESGWVGGVRRADRDTRAARGGLGEANDRRDLLLPALHAVQDRVGWISRGALNYICKRLIVPPAEAWGVLTFYHLFKTEPAPATVVHVCDDIACRLKGAERICRELGRSEDRPLQGNSTWQCSPCLGQCDRAPAALIVRAGEQPSTQSILHIKDAKDIVDSLARLTTESSDLKTPEARGSEARALALAYPGLPKLLARVGKVDPTSLDSYRQHGGYRALARALEIGADTVIKEVIASNLLGRGGAAFPTGRKWEAVAKQPATPHFVVCNADESEPGTFKDRVLIESDPFALVEAMTIAAFATRSSQGFVYVRGEYPLARTRLQDALDTARRAGLVGRRILGSDFGFDIEIRRGAGAYICGEETALFNSLEGKRGEPRSKPPFPVHVGLFGKPTVVNNVETLVNVIDIVLEGGAVWAVTGTRQSTGSRLFCLSGHVARPGLYEALFGITLGELVEQAGGVAGGRPLQAILLGGAAGTFVGPEALSMKLTFEDVRTAGATLGSGVVMVFDDTADIADALVRIAKFMEDESCGQCVPCRVGTVRQVEILERVIGRSKDRPPQGSQSRHAEPIEDLKLLGELGQCMRDASICGLGQTASSAVESAIANLHVFRNGDAP